MTSWTGWPISCPGPAVAVFGPFDGDFDPFEDDDEIAVLITFGRSRVRRRRQTRR